MIFTTFLSEISPQAWLVSPSWPGRTQEAGTAALQGRLGVSAGHINCSAGLGLLGTFPDQTLDHSHI